MWIADPMYHLHVFLKDSSSDGCEAWLLFNACRWLNLKNHSLPQSLEGVMLSTSIVMAFNFVVSLEDIFYILLTLR